MLPDRSEMERLVGHRFPGGQYRIEHWENFLLSEATGVAPLPDSLAHPVHLFHVPISGAAITIGELFELAQADRAAPVSIDYYDWEIFEPLREGVTYQLSGGITLRSTCSMFRRTTVLFVGPWPSILTIGGIETKCSVTFSGSFELTRTSRSPTVSFLRLAEPATSTRLTASFPPI